MKIFKIISLSLLLIATSARGDTIQATVDWAQTFELGPLVGGTVVSTSANAGDRLDRGGELLRIDPAPYQHQIVISEAQVKSAESLYESAQQAHQRQQELFDIGSLSTVALQESSYAVTRAESDYRLARAKLDIARHDLAQTILKTPFDAWIIDKRAFVGQNLSTQQTIPVSFVVAPVGEYLAVANAAGTFENPPPIGTALRLEVNGKSYTGKLTFPRYSAEHELNRFTVRFSELETLILPGTPGMIVIPD